MVRDEHHGNPLFAAQARHGLDDLAPAGRVEHRGRLVEHDALRLHGDHARDGDALLLSARKQVRRVHAKFIHPHLFERRVHPPADLLRRHAEILRREGYVVLDDVGDDLVVGVLKHHAHRAAHPEKLLLVGSVDPVYQHPALRGQQNCVQVLGERRFAGAVVAEHRHKRAGPDLQIQVLQRRLRLAGVGIAQMFDFDNRFHVVSFSISISFPSASPPKTETSFRF